MAYISIMQGRLSPPENGRFQSFPRSNWENEFAAASEAQLSGIEWIYDEYGRDINPLLDKVGVAKMAQLAESNGVTIRSLCADYYMDHPILRAPSDDRRRILADFVKLRQRCESFGIRRIVVPFVDSSRITSRDDEELLVRFFEDAIKEGDSSKVEIHLETDLNPKGFARLMLRLDYPVVKVNYDSGNSAYLGYDCIEELDSYGERIGSVHIKDRVLGGGTVPLGEGAANLSALFDKLRDLDYAGDYVLQVARGAAGDEISWARYNVEYVENLFTELGLV